MYFKKNKLFIEKVDGLKIAQKFGTPTYCYSLGKLKENIQSFQKNFRSIALDFKTVKNFESKLGQKPNYIGD